MRLRNAPLLLALVLFPACDPPAVDTSAINDDRYDACDAGYACTLSCDLPNDELAALGCSPRDPEGTYPNCSLTVNCTNVVLECYSACEVQFPEFGPEQLECKAQCEMDAPMLEVACEAEHQAWIDARNALIAMYDQCKIPCEGEKTIAECDAAEMPCDPITQARHRGVAKAEECNGAIGTPDAESACQWTCSDEFKQHDL
jgi:hypothetical protein